MGSAERGQAAQLDAQGQGLLIIADTLETSIDYLTGRSDER